jgi:hypothetical protein
VTPPRGYPDPAAATPADGTLARQFTEPLREVSALALLAGNGVFLFLGFTGLFLVLDRWASEFGLRCAQVFSTFVGPGSLGLPMVALLLATHVAPMVRRTRLVLIVVLSELAVSAVFGALTFLGAFANDLSSPRATIEGTLWRVVWLGFLVLACVLAARMWMGLYPAPKPRPAGHGGYPKPAYGQPYPGQPLYPHQAPTYPVAATPATGWPLVPPPPMPEPLVLQTAEPTVRMSPEMIETAGELTTKVSTSGELTQRVPTSGDLTQQMPLAVEIPTQETPQVADDRPESGSGAPAEPAGEAQTQNIER